MTDSLATCLLHDPPQDFADCGCPFGDAGSEHYRPRLVAALAEAARLRAELAQAREHTEATAAAMVDVALAGRAELDARTITAAEQRGYSEGRAGAIAECKAAGALYVLPDAEDVIEAFRAATWSEALCSLNSDGAPVQVVQAAIDAAENLRAIAADKARAVEAARQEGDADARTLDAFLDRLGARATGTGGQQVGEEHKARVADGARRLDAMLAARQGMRAAVDAKRAEKLVAAHESAVEEMRYTDRRRPPLVAAARKVVETTRAALLAALTGEVVP